MAEPADINVDDLRRRARRRLVGAIVLALGAAVIVPMLLESEPKPLGESVAVKIPPVDDGKFVNRLTDGAPKSDSANSASKEARNEMRAAAATPRKSVGDAEKAVIAPNAKAPKYDTQVATDRAAAPAAAAQAPTAAAPVAPLVEAVPAPNVEAKTAAPSPVPEPPPAPATSEPAKDAYAVQLAAFSDDKGANALANRLKRAGYSAYTEPLKTSRGTLWRVRVGPYPSRESANGVRDKLKAEGQNGIVAPAH